MVGKGIVLLLPTFTTEQIAESVVRETEVAYVEALLDFIKALKVSTGDFTLPVWTERFRLSGEPNRLAEIEEKERKITEVIADRDKLKEELKDIQSYKLLLSGTGRALEAIVKRVLTELGFEIREGAPGRDDFVAEYSGRAVVIEVKGKTKSAAERDAAQLEKWVSGHLEQTGIEPKGLLIVNAFCETPLDQRNEGAFPDQMRPYASRKGLCLMTTSQLLALYSACRANPACRDELIQKILDTVGVLPDYDVSAYLQVDAASVSEPSLAKST